MHEVSQQVYELLLRYGEIPEADEANILRFIQRLDANPEAIKMATSSPSVYAIGVLLHTGIPLTEAGEHQKAKHIEAVHGVEPK